MLSLVWLHMGTIVCCASFQTQIMSGTTIYLPGRIRCTSESQRNLNITDLTLIGCIKHNGTRCTMKSKQTMDDKAWIREDTLTMQLAIPPDLRIYNRHTYKNEMAQSNWCNRMAKDE